MTTRSTHRAESLTVALVQRERNWFIEQLQTIARTQRLRITLLSGDVHCAAVGVLKTFTGKKDPEVAPGLDHRYMINVVTSKHGFPTSERCQTKIPRLLGAIVNTPP